MNAERSAHSVKCKRYHVRRHQMGGSTLVDAGPTRAIIADLATRMSYSAIARGVGTSHNWVSKVHRGTIKRVSPKRAAQIRKLANYRPIDNSHVDPTGSIRRLRALHALGYSWARMSAHIDGYSETAMKSLVLGRTPVLEAANAESIRVAYERLCMTLPVAANRNEQSGITRARNTSKRNGWLPPLAWDDIDRDSRPVVLPSQTVDPVVVERLLGGDWRIVANRAEKLAALATWDRIGGLSDNEIERRCGWNVVRLRKQMRREAAA